MQPTRPRGNSSGTVPVGVPIQSRPRTGSRRRANGRQMGWDGMGGVPKDGFELNQDGTKRQRRIHLESSRAMPRTLPDSLGGDSRQLGLGRCQSVLQSAMHLCCLDRRQQRGLDVVLGPESVTAAALLHRHGCHYTTMLSDSPNP